MQDLSELLPFFQRHSMLKRVLIIFAGLFLMALTGYGDYYTGTEVLFSVFYIVPIALWAWYLGALAAIVGSCLCVILWVFGDFVVHHTPIATFLALWNSAVIFSFFILISISLAALRRSFEIQKSTNRSLLRSYEDMRKLLEMKSRFVAMASHEIRTPLTAMIQATDIMEETLRGKLDEKQARVLEILHHASDRLLRLVDNVLDFSKVELGERKFHVTKGSLNAVVNNVLLLHRPVAEKKGLELLADLDERLPETYFDEDSVAQVLHNLVSNAIKNTSQGAITIGTKFLGSRVQLYVRDTGPGISPENLDKMFKPFVQIAPQGKPAVPGTGLGLSISKQLVERQRGKIWVNSEVGTGTAFYFWIPAKVQSLIE